MDTAERNEAAAAAMGTLVLGGRPYLVEPITAQDMATFHAHARKAIRAAQKPPLEAVAGSLAALPPHLHKEVLAAAVKAQTAGVAVSEEAAQDYLQTPDGAAFLLWVLLRKQERALTLKAVRDAIPDEEAAIVVLADLYTAAGMDKLDPKALASRGGRLP